MLIALVLYEGVLSDECEAFRSVLTRVTDAEFVTVAAHVGTVRGPGGSQLAMTDFEAFLNTNDRVDVVVVPGGLGCERAAEDHELRCFLTAMTDRADLIAASSTGSVLLAAAGLLGGQPAATHWLAATLLKRYGSDADHRRLAIRGKVVTCEGRISAVDAAFALVERVEHPQAAERIRNELLAASAPLLNEPRWWEPLINALADRFRSGRRTAPPTDTTPPASVVIELVDDPQLAARIRRNATRR